MEFVLFYVRYVVRDNTQWCNIWLWKLNKVNHENVLECGIFEWMTLVLLLVFNYLYNNWQNLKKKNSTYVIQTLPKLHLCTTLKILHDFPKVRPKQQSPINSKVFHLLHTWITIKNIVLFKFLCENTNFSIKLSSFLH